MTLSDISIKNPVFAWILMFGLIIFGLIGLLNMGISQLPDVDFPVITISVNWSGASPVTMESAIADVIEDSIMTIEGIRNVKSTSYEGVTNISIEFELNRDINVAMQEVQTKILQAQKNLPSDVDTPTISKTNPEDQPIMYTSLYGSKDRRKMILEVRNKLKDVISTIDGVGDVRLGGYVDPNMRIWLDSRAMSDKEITVEDIISAVNGQHLLTPSGYLNNGPRETNIRIYSELENARDFSNLLIPSRRGEAIWTPIRLSDVATVEEGLADIRRISRFNGQLSVSIGIIKQRGSNAVSVARAVKERYARLKSIIPSDMSLGIAFDSTKFIENSTRELYTNLFLSVLLTSIVCWLFLGTWSSAMNVIIAIPVSLIGSFIILYFCGFTLNTFTLLGLSLSIGIVVDDAIMVLENIVRHHETGLSRVKASIIGAREITGPAIAASLAVLAIFLPVIFMKGIIGKFFFQFGITMSVAVMISLLEALTLAPMRCSQMLTEGKENILSRKVNRFMDYLTVKYKNGLSWCLQNRVKTISGAFLIFGLSLLIVGSLKKEMVPAQDQSRFMATVQLPLGSSIDYTDQIMKKAEEFIRTRPEVESFITNVGGFQGGMVNQGTMMITMKDPGKRPVASPFTHRPGQQEFMPFIRNELKKIPGVSRVTVMDPSLAGFSAQRGYPIEFTVQGPDWDKLSDYSRKIMDKMNESRMVTDVDTDYKPGMPELRIVPDRQKAAARGVTISNIADTLSSTVSSLRIGKYTDETGRRNDIRVSLQRQDSKNENDIKNIRLRNSQGEMVPLSQLVSFDQKPSMLSIIRYNRERAISVFANIAPGRSQADILEMIEKNAATILPEGYHIEFTGSSKTFNESFDSLIFALVLGIIVAYMVLGSQFNSFLHPAIILLALPFSVTGAFMAMKATGMSLNIYSMIGLLLLMGIVKKNSILLVDFTNKRRVMSGLSIHDALMDACPVRLRPIIMTSVATVAAAVPPALSLGAGSETTRPMAIVVIGGVIISTLLTLFVVPCAYSLFSRFESKKHRKELHEALLSLGEIKE